MANKYVVLALVFILGLMDLAFLSGMFPVFGTVLDGYKASDSLNCQGYVDPNTALLGINNHSYNPFVATQPIGCAFVGPYPSLVFLVILLAFAMKLIYPESEGPAPVQYQ